MSNTITQFISLLPIDKKENNLLKYVFHANKACHVSVIYVGYELLEITTLYVLTNQDSNCCFKHLSTHEYEIMYGRKSCLVLTVIIQYESSNVMGFFQSWVILLILLSTMAALVSICKFLSCSMLLLLITVCWDKQLVRLPVGDGWKHIPPLSVRLLPRDYKHKQVVTIWNSETSPSRPIPGRKKSHKSEHKSIRALDSYIL